jgi:GT2 family glycosyltransferase
LIALVPVPADAAHVALYRESGDASSDLAATAVWTEVEPDADIHRTLESFGAGLDVGIIVRGLLRAAVAHRAARAERLLRSQLRTGSYQMRLDRPFGLFVDELMTFPGRGYFVSGWVYDPGRQISAAYVVPPSGKRVRIDLDQCRTAREDVLDFFQIAAPLREGMRLGFVAFADDPDAAESFVDDVLVALEGDATVTVAAEQRPLDALEKRRRVLCAADARDVLDMRRLAPAFAAAQQEVVRNARVVARLSYDRGTAQPPRFSLVVPLYRRIDFARYQLAEFANDPELAEAEVVYVLDSPEQRVELTELLRSWTAIWPVRTRLLVMERNAGFAAATNAGVREAQGSVCVLLNSDVFPAAPGWLGTMHRALVTVPSAGVVGPQLIYEDGAIQHAGMYYAENRLGLWSNEHFFKGYPRDFPAATVSRYVPAVTGACMMVRRELFLALGGLSEEYCVGDFEDSDFCNKAAAAGVRAWYESTAVLYHLERQSFGLSAYNHLGWRYNQWLHESRWRNAAERIPAGAAV